VKPYWHKHWYEIDMGLPQVVCHYTICCAGGSELPRFSLIVANDHKLNEIQHHGGRIHIMQIGGSATFHCHQLQILRAPGHAKSAIGFKMRIAVMVVTQIFRMATLDARTLEW
jgi:hypothetical protein